MAGVMTGKMAEPICMAGGTPQEIMAGIAKMADYTPSKEQEYVCLKLLYNLSKYATLPDFLAACQGYASMGITKKQYDLIEGFVKVLSKVTW